jgi:hypothetical protein
LGDENVNGTEGETTGDERVDAAIARLGELEEARTAAHPEIFQDVHRRLQDALAGIDGEQA